MQWDLCAANLDRVEMFRSKSSDYLANSGVSSSYSFLSLDPEWGTTQKSGAWGNDEIKLVGSLHQDLIQSPNITEVIVRLVQTMLFAAVRNYLTRHFSGTKMQSCMSIDVETPKYFTIREVVPQ